MYKLFTDGGSRGNPGKAAYGYLVYDNNDKLVDFGGEHLNIATNNFAEYTGLINGLKQARKLGINEIVCHLDSELVVKQLNREYKVKHPDIIPLFQQATELASMFEVIKFIYIPRAENKFADKLVNLILDQYTNA